MRQGDRRLPDRQTSDERERIKALEREKSRVEAGQRDCAQSLGVFCPGGARMVALSTIPVVSGSLFLPCYSLFVIHVCSFRDCVDMRFKHLIYRHGSGAMRKSGEMLYLFSAVYLALKFLRRYR